MLISLGASCGASSEGVELLHSHGQNNGGRAEKGASEETLERGNPRKG